MKKESGFEIKAEERQSWVSIAMVWIGSVICVPALMIGGMLGSGLSLGACVLAILIGYALICVFMSFMGALGCDEAFDNADILVMDEKIGKLPIAVKAARFTQLVVKENTGLALIAKFALLAGSALGFVPIAAAAAVDSGVVILSLINSLRALGSWKE